MARKSRESWQEVFRDLGASILEVFQAEISVLMEEWQRSLRYLLVALALLSAVVFVLFWFVGLLVYAAVDFVGRWFTEPWQAALVVAGLALLVMVAAGAVAWMSLRKVELFTATRRRFTEHMAWWQGKILHQELEPTEGERDVQPYAGP